MSIPSPHGAPDRSAPVPRRSCFFQLRVAAILGAWVLVAAGVLRLINAHDFGPPGMLGTLAKRFAVESVLLTTMAWGAMRSLPFGLKPGWRGTTALGLWIALVVLSDCLSRLEFGTAEAMLEALRDAMGMGGFLLAVLAYMLALALPFVPGVEIGLLVMMVFGAAGAMAVYGATVAGLSLAFAAGRLIPEPVLARLLHRLGIALTEGRPDSAMASLAAGSPPGGGAWRQLLRRLMKYRYLSLGVSLNLPGNSVLGGGGGIALLCGASRQFRWQGFVLTVVVATSPVPLLVIAGGIDIGDLVHLNHAVQNLFGRLVGWF